MNYWKFFRKNQRFLSFGVLTTVFSNIGQTFLVALFVPSFLLAFGLSNSEFGIFYSAATLLSAFCLPVLGGKIDTTPLRKYALWVSLGLLSSCLLLAISPNLIVFFVAIFGLRLFGQGLCTHIAATSIASRFSLYRGKALSISWLGFSIGEASLPLFTVALIAALGWRGAWFALAALVAVVFVFGASFLLKKEPLIVEGIEEREFKGTLSSDHPKALDWTSGEVFRDSLFYLLLPGVIIPPFFLTGLFLYQVSIAEGKGWTTEWIASAFIAFAISRFIASLVVGPLVDRFSAYRLFPIYLFPFGAALTILYFFELPLIAFVYLFLAGFTVGMGGNIKSAMWAEIYGVKHLGAIRSFISTVMIVSTALSPLVMGTLLDMGVPISEILILCVFGIILAILLSFFAVQRVHRRVMEVSILR
jgi:MFS family permease